MKIRAGFVSNSSSSSFCLIGVSNEDDIKALMEACGLKWVTGGEYPKLIQKSINNELDDGDDADQWGGYIKTNVLDFVMSDYNPDNMIGAGIGTSILETMTLPEARKYFASLVKKELGVTIHPKDVELISGECSDGG